MSKILKSASVSFLLFIGDLIIVLAINITWYFIDHIFLNKKIYTLQNYLSVYLMLFSMRFFYNLLITIIVFYFLIEKVSKPFELSLINSGVYIVTSLVFALLLRFKLKDFSEFFTSIPFLLIVLATIISPLLLSFIPAFRKLVGIQQ
jgi:hypothetical protein